MKLWKFLADEGCELVYQVSLSHHPDDRVLLKYRQLVIPIVPRLYRNEEIMHEYFEQMKPEWDNLIKKYEDAGILFAIEHGNQGTTSSGYKRGLRKW